MLQLHPPYKHRPCSYCSIWLLMSNQRSSCHGRSSNLSCCCYYSVAQSWLTLASASISQPSHPLSPSFLLALNLSQHQSLFQWVGSLHQVAKLLELQLQHQSLHEYSGLISFRIDWFGLAVQGALKSLLQHHSSKASILRYSAFFTVQLSQPYMTTGKTIDLTIRTFVSKVMSLLFNMLSRFVIVFLPRSKHFLISWL